MLLQCVPRQTQTRCCCQWRFQLPSRASRSEEQLPSRTSALPSPQQFKDFGPRLKNHPNSPGSDKDTIGKVKATLYLLALRSKDALDLGQPGNSRLNQRHALWKPACAGLQNGDSVL